MDWTGDQGGDGGEERGLDAELLALSLVLDILALYFFYQCPERRQKAFFLGF